MEDQDGITEKTLQLLTNSITTTRDIATDSSMYISTGGGIGVGTTHPNYNLHVSGGTHVSGNTGNISYGTHGLDPYAQLTNEERIDAILTSMTTLTDAVNTLKTTARALISEMKIEKHERRTLGKTEE